MKKSKKEFFLTLLFEVFDECGVTSLHVDGNHRIDCFYIGEDNIKITYDDIQEYIDTKRKIKNE